MKKPTHKPTRSRFTLLRQLCNLIPNHLVATLAREHGADAKSRTFTPWSHVVSLLFAQLTHALGLNDVCDALRLHSGPLSAIRGATPPSKNALSHANRERDPKMAEALFWRMLEELQRLAPGFGGRRRPRFAFRFKRMIHVVDSTTIQLVASCIDWAKHRRRKAAAKCHVRLNLQSFLQQFAIVDTAREHDNVRARELCAGVRAGEIVIFDKAYVDFEHLADLAMREVSWVTRAKENLEYRVVRKFQRGRIGNILAEALLEWKIAGRISLTVGRASTSTRWALRASHATSLLAIRPQLLITPDCLGKDSLLKNGQSATICSTVSLGLNFGRRLSSTR